MPDPQRWESHGFSRVEDVKRVCKPLGRDSGLSIANPSFPVTLPIITWGQAYGQPRMSTVPAPTSRTLLALVISLSVLAGGLATGAPTTQSDETADARADATPLPVNTTTEGTIDTENDSDWYAVEVGDQRTLVPHLALPGGYDQERGSGNPVERKDLNFTVYGPDGERLGEGQTGSWHGGQPGGAAIRVSEAGTYYIQIQAEYAGQAEDPLREANGSQDYTLSVDSFAWDPHEPNQNRSAATGFNEDLATSTHLFGFDDDYYATDLAAGDTVTITYRETSVIHGYVHHDVYVYGPDGDQVAHTAHEERNGSVTFTAETTGRYTVAVAVDWDEAEAYSIRGSDGVLYDLTVDVGDDTGETTETPTATEEPTATDEPTTTSTATPTATSTAPPTAEPTATEEQPATAEPDDDEDPPADAGADQGEETPTVEPTQFEGEQRRANQSGQAGKTSPAPTQTGVETSVTDRSDDVSTVSSTGTATSGPGFGALAALVALVLLAVVRRGE